MQAGGGGDDELARLKQLYGMGGDDADMSKQMEEVMEMMMKMDPAELERQMKQAMELLTSGDMLKDMLEHRDEIIKTLEETQAVPPEELARFKTDPEYFESKMAESFDQMQGIFNDPDAMKLATEQFGNMQKLFENPETLNEMWKELAGNLQDDEEIEKARLEILNGLHGLPDAMKEQFETPEMQALLSDPEKWKANVKEGADLLTGAGVGEL
jgi:flagellar hook-associated protein FlgK